VKEDFEITEKKFEEIKLYLYRDGSPDKEISTFGLSDLEIEMLSLGSDNVTLRIHTYNKKECEVFPLANDSYGRHLVYK
jgi:hypothetical protein